MYIVFSYTRLFIRMRQSKCESWSNKGTCSFPQGITYYACTSPHKHDINKTISSTWTCCFAIFIKHLSNHVPYYNSDSGQKLSHVVSPSSRNDQFYEKNYLWHIVSQQNRLWCMGFLLAIYCKLQPIDNLNLSSACTLVNLVIMYRM